MFEHTSSAQTSIIWAVDDEPDVLLSLGGLLEDAGFGFRGFEDPVDFFEAFGEEASGPDLAIIDLNLPNLSGAELIRKVRGIDRGAHLPIVVLTALSSEGSLLNAFEAGADDVVRKPYSLSELLARITWQLSRTRQLQILKRKNADLELLTELAQMLSRDTKLGTVLETLTSSLAGAVSGAEVEIFLVGADNELEAFASRPSDERTVLDLRDLRDARETVSRREAGTFAEESASGLARELGRENWMQCCSAVIVPLMVRETFIGVLTVTSTETDLAEARESYLTSIIADFSALAVHRAQLFQSVVQESARIDEANRELARTRDFLSNVIDASPDAIIVSDRKGQIVVFNSAAEETLGYTRGDAIGRDVRMLYPEKGAERVKRMMVSEGWGGRGRLHSQRIEVLDADGESVPVRISASVLHENGEETGTVGIFTDVRSELRMEEQLNEATKSLEKTKRQAMIAELAGAAAHELNQPLTSLLGYAELMDSRLDDDDENRRPLDTIISESQRIANIVRKIGRITQYKTKEYVGGTRIFDLDSASEVEEADVAEDDTSDFKRPDLTKRMSDAELPPDEEESP